MQNYTNIAVRDPDPKDFPRPVESSFSTIADKIAGFTLASFNDPAETARYVDEFSLQKVCSALKVDRIGSRNSDLKRSVTAFEERPFQPQYADLCRLHYLVLKRKCINILELGSGYSTAVMADALRLLSRSFHDWALDNIRCQDPFHVFAVEEDQRFLEITRERLGSRLGKFATVTRSSVDLIVHDNRIATVFSTLPNIAPDFIYVDGPSQFGTTSELNGLSFNSISRMPMSADVLRFEFFLEPGALVMVDGRTQNARFLKSYLKRNWAYSHDTLGDVHYFELQEAPLGKYNKRRMDFCLGGEWMLPDSLSPRL